MSALEALKNRRASQQAQIGRESSPGISADPSAGAGPEGPANTMPAPATKKVQAHAWMCNTCNAECVPIRSESRCLCGHRHKEHAKLQPGVLTARCQAAKCTCSGFFFIMAEGAWILRCACKHKHVEHDPASHACKKPGCTCAKFHSPWVCNCDHPWGDHTQIVVEREVMTLEGMMAAASLAELTSGQAADVNRFDLVKRGQP